MALVYGDRVLESSTTTGTGALTLAAAITGFQRFSAVCSVADTCYYAAYAVDANGTPTGDWETGLGTYSSSNTLTRTTVSKSSNANAAVNFAAGTKYVALTIITNGTVVLPNAGLIVGAVTNSANVPTSHMMQISASGSVDPLAIIGGSGVVQIWKDTTPSKANSFGMAVPGVAITDDWIFSRYNGTAWFETFRIANASGNATFIGTVTVPDDVYAAGWDANLAVPTKNAVYDKVQTLVPLVVKYDSAGANIGASLADYFTATISLEASSSYEITAHAYFLKNTAGTFLPQWAFSSAPIMATSRVQYTPVTGFTTSVITGAEVFAEATQQASTTLIHAATASLSNAVYHSFFFTLLVRTNAATTLQLRCTESAGTVTPQAGSYMRATKVV